MQKVMMAALLGLATIGGLAATPTVAKADQCYASYRWEYRIVSYKVVAYTAYDYCGCPYTAYKRVPVYGWVKVYGY